MCVYQMGSLLATSAMNSSQILRISKADLGEPVHT